MTQINYDASEIAKFEKMAANWWDVNGECKPLHDINPLRLAFIKEHATLVGANVLDIGCGGGILSESLAESGAQVTGIDLSEAAIGAAKTHNASQPNKVYYQVTAAETLAESNPEQFDIITCMELLEHVPDPAQLIQSCAKLVKPGGKVFFSTINRNPKAYLYTVLGAEYVLKMLPKGTHDYAKFIRPAELATWMRQSGLTLKELKGMQYNPFTRHYHLDANVSVNYLAYCIREL